MQRAHLVHVYQDTLAKLHMHKAPQPSVKVSSGDLQEIQQELIFRNNVTCVDMDTFDAVEFNKSPRTCVLNMASYQHPGGGVINGATAQEECLFRRSNYVQTLETHFYPLEKDELIWSPDITVFKSSTYEPLQVPFKCSAIACAALRKPRLNSRGGYLHYGDYKCMEEKIEAIFKLAIKHKVKTLILSAFGCGAYGNNPSVVSELMFNIAFKYSQHFDNVVFAIIGPNYKPFKQQLNKLLDPTK